jgi:hypothetical protein
MDARVGTDRRSMVGWAVIVLIASFAALTVASLVFGVVSGFGQAPGYMIGVLLVFLGVWAFLGWGALWWLGWFPLVLGVVMIAMFIDGLG